VGEPFGYVTRLNRTSACLELEGTFDEVHDLARTPLEGCHDVFIHEDSPSLGYDYVIPNPLDHSHVSTTCSQPSSSPEFDLDVPIDSYEICDSNIDLGNEDEMFNMLGGNVANFLSLGYFSGMMPPLTYIAYT